MKNKLAPPFRTASFELEFGKGICHVSEIISLGLKHKLVSKAGAMYSFNGHSFRGKEAFKQFLGKNSEVREGLLSKLREKLLYEVEKLPEAKSSEGDGASEEVISADEESPCCS